MLYDLKKHRKEVGSHMNSIFERRSIRKYHDRPVAREEIKKILQAGIFAPSSKNRQPWKFVVVGGAEKERMLSAMKRGLSREKTGIALLPQSRCHLAGAEHTLEIMKQAPVTIFVVNPLGLALTDSLTPEDRIYEICNTQSIGAALENMALAATELGLGSLWICDIFFAYEELTDWLHIDDGTLTAAMALGFADERPLPRPRKPLAESVEWRI